MGLLDKKNAIITGANRGIGKYTVETFAEQGANIWACARAYSPKFNDEMEAIAQKYEVSIWPVYFDLTNETDLKIAIRTIRKDKLQIDVLVNAAGVVDESTSFHMTSMSKIRHVLEVNFFATTLLIQYVSRFMMQQGEGSIINIASIAGIDGAPAQYEYVASKAAIIGITKNLAREFASHNIRVNAIAPGIIDTDMGNQIEENLKKEVLSKTMMKRLGHPKEVADVIAFLASDMASYMTGQIIRVDGGM